jgi:hypothetical protein
MIHIKETFPDELTVIIQVDGRLDKDTLEPLELVFERYAKGSKKIVFSLNGLMSISKEGCHFFERIKDQVSITGMSEFLRMALTT